MTFVSAGDEAWLAVAPLDEEIRGIAPLLAVPSVADRQGPFLIRLHKGIMLEQIERGPREQASLMHCPIQFSA